VRQEDSNERLAHSASEGDLSLLREIGQAMRDASICGLGQTAASAIESAVTRLGVFSVSRGQAGERRSAAEPASSEAEPE
jgi:NADH-quinone oxidoreductase subunit F